MLGFLKQFLKKPAEDDASDDWPSIVFLLRSAVLPNAEEAIEMAKTAWGVANPVTLIGAVGPHNFAIRSGPLDFALHAVDDRYETCALELTATQQVCWDQHRAWLAIDMPGKRCGALRQNGDLAGAYLALLYFVDKHWTTNSVGLYFPGELATLPNCGSLTESIRSARRDGIDLDFLKGKRAQ